MTLQESPTDHAFIFADPPPRVASSWLPTLGGFHRKCGRLDVARVHRLAFDRWLWVTAGASGIAATADLAGAFADRELARAGWEVQS